MGLYKMVKPKDRLTFIRIRAYADGLKFQEISTFEDQEAGMNAR